MKEQIAEALTGILALTITYAFGQLGALIRRKIKRQEVEDLAVDINDAVRDAVLDAAQRVVSGKRRPGEGLPAEIAKQALETALDGVKDALGPRRLELLEKVYPGKVDVVLRQKVEAAVARLKGRSAHA
jgi:hypothetical protein